MSQVNLSSKCHVLVVALDWGLGHATRCVPVIRALLQKGCTVSLAGEGRTKDLLEKEFPELNFLPLAGYRVVYARQKWWQPILIAKQIPKILSAIKKENQWLKAVVEQYGFDGVISDNRFGLHYSAIPSVFITHQLSIKSGFGNVVDRWLQKLNYRHINQFSECWVPDAGSGNNLGGQLSHPPTIPAIPVKYTGPLSRFANASAAGAKHILLLLSGPEPQRTLLEDLLLEQLKNYTAPVVLIRGLPGNKEEINPSANVTVFNHLAAKDLQQKMEEASFVISRSGYSTVMDLAALKKKGILIPTPGQTEQEYLAKHLMQKNFALCIEQRKFNLQQALNLAATFEYHVENFNAANNLQEVITAFAEKLMKKKQDIKQ